jgi:4-amino-4-deoxy-L-arabinose transferase-like glycosyltransferase
MTPPDRLADARRRRPPAPLLALLAVVALLTTASALVTPPWQSPDEPAHFSYVQTIGEQGRLPGGKGHEVSTQLSRAAEVTNWVPVIFEPAARPEWTRVRADAFAHVERRSPVDDGGGPSDASTYPPLYYAAQAVPYLAAKSAGTFTRLSVVRITSGLWLLVTVTGAWLLAGELFGRRRLHQFVAAATVGLWPELTAISASVNPDALVTALWTLTLWMGVKILRRGLTPRRGLALGAFTGAALVTKVATLALAPVVVLLAAGAAWRAWRADRGRAALALGLALGAIALPLGAWTVGTAASGRGAYTQASDISTHAQAGGFQAMEFASYVWQFYLPKLPFMTPVHHNTPEIARLPVINTWLGQGSAAFGWLNVWFPRWVYGLLGLALLGVLVLFAAASARWWRATPEGRLRCLAPAGFLAAATLATVGALHYTDYAYYAGKQGMFMQGRYLLPLAGGLAAVVGWALTAVPARRRVAVAGVWVGGLLAFEVASLGLRLVHWYA